MKAEGIKQTLRRFCVGSALLVALIGSSSPILFGQGTAYLTGFVLDPSGAAVPNATVAIRNEATGVALNLKTTTAGVYTSPALAPGTYHVTVTATGFQTSTTSGVAVLTGQPRGLNITLRVGAVSQQVQVTAAPPLLKTEDAGLGQNVTYSQVASLPYFSRSAGVLMSLAPTVRYTGENLVSYGASRYNVGGMTNVNVSIDGAPINGDREDVAQVTLNPSVESLSEVKVTTNQYSAQFGRDVGALVQMQTKSGTNQYHGGVYEYLRNEALDTFNGFTRTKPSDRLNMFGGTIGGPIKKDKLFFFGSLEGQKATEPGTALFTVPTPAMKAGDFSGLVDSSGRQIPIYDPATSTVNAAGQTVRTQFPGNIIPTSRFDAAAVKALAFIPNPTLPGLGRNLPVDAGLSRSQWRGVERVDWSKGDKDSFFGVWMFDHVTNPFSGWNAYRKTNVAASPPFNAGPGFQYFSNVIEGHWLHTFSPTFFMSTKFVDRPRWIKRLNPSVDPSAKWAEKLGIQNYAGARLPASFGGDLGFPTYNFSGYTQLGPGFLLFQERPIREDSWDIDFTYIHGKHTIKFGFGTERGVHGAPNQFTPTGSFGFSPTETGLPGATGRTGDAFASFLLGQVDNANTILGPLEIWHNWYWAPYIEDDWKVRPNLTFNLGFRWDVDGPVYEDHNFGNSFDFFQINPVSGTPGVIKFFNRPGYPYNNFYNTDYHRFAPRFGFAWQLLPKTVIRGGYGIFNTSPILGANRQAPNLGFTTSASFGSPDAGVSPAFILQNGFPNYPLGGNLTTLTDSFGAVPVGAIPTTSPNFVDRNWKFGYAQNFNLSIQRELPWGMVLEVAGQGVLGRNLSIFQNWNEVPPQFWGIPGRNNARRPFPQFGNVTQVKSQKGTTNYYDGYVRLNKHFSQGFTLIGNYSYGRTLGFMGGSMYFPQLSRGPAVYDEANGVTAVPYQTANISWVYELPFGTGKRFLAGGPAAKVLGGWSVGGIFSALGGVPYGIGSGTDSLNGNSPLGGRVNLIGDPHAGPQTHDHWFNTAAFATPAFGTIGTYGCCSLLGPSDKRLDLSLRKTTNITERYKVTIVGEFFNFTNTLQFGPPDGNLRSPNFGRTLGPGGGLGGNTGAPSGGSRQIQIGARIDF